MKRIAVDFDGTLCEDAYPEIGAVKPGAVEALRQLRAAGFFILIWSCRTCSWDAHLYPSDPDLHPYDREPVQAMVAWLEANQIPFDAIDDGQRGKPNAAFYIDDKGVRFNNNWEGIADGICAAAAPATHGTEGR